MAIIGFNSNIYSLLAQRNLARASRENSSASEKLSSGLRINRASDDAAGLAVSSVLNARSRIYGAAVRNANDAISALNIADGGLSQLTSVLHRMRELATGAANGTYSRNQRVTLDRESAQLSEEYNRIVQTTTFNGRQLLNGSLSDLGIQLGIGANERINFGVAQNITRQIGQSFGAAASVASVSGSSDVATGDFNGDGRTDYVVHGTHVSGIRTQVYLANANGTFASGATIDISLLDDNPGRLAVADLNNDGKLDIVNSSYDSNNDQTNLRVYYGSANGTFSIDYAASLTGYGLPFERPVIADFNNDGRKDIAWGQQQILFRNTSGGYDAGYQPPTSITFAADVNSDGHQDIFLNDGTLQLGNGNGTFGSARNIGFGGQDVRTGDFNRDGIIDIASVASLDSNLRIQLGNGDGTFQAVNNYGLGGTSVGAMELNDYDGDGLLDAFALTAGGVVGVLRGNADGSFGRRIEGNMGVGTTVFGLGDFNGDGVTDIVSALSGFDQRVFGVGATTTTMQRLNLTTREEALGAINIIDSLLTRIQREIGSLGSSQSRLESAQRNLLATTENYTTAASRITDTDIASESARLVSSQILQQTAAAVLGQANLSPQIALRLLL